MWRDQRLDMSFDAVAVGFAGLRGDVAHVDLERVALSSALAIALDQQVRDDAGVQAAGAEHDEVGLQDAR